MRFKHKKIFISGTAVATAGALGVGALLQTVTSVQASSDMMPGIEQIVNDNTEEAPFRILELVNDSADAEIGYYISGQEPSLKLFQYQYTDSDGHVQTVHFSSVQDALSKLPAEQRQEFMQNIRINSDGTTDSNTGIKNIQSVSGDDGPLTYTEYQETYFTGDNSDWTKVDLTDFNGNSRTDTVSVNGTYQENSSGTGNYTKGEQAYYPIRNGVQADQEQTGKYRENIQSFYPSEGSDSRGSYYLEFAPVSNDKVDAELEKDKGQTALLPEYDYANGRYGYYENVYTDLTEEIVNDINAQSYQFPGENPVGFSESDGVLIQNNEKEAVQSTIAESDAFTSGEKNSTDTSEDTAQDSFSEDSGSDSVDFDNAYQSDGEDGFASGDTETLPADTDVSLELQSYETPIESAGDADAEFTDDFSDEEADTDEQSENVETEDSQDSTFFDEETEGTDAAEQTETDTTDDIAGRTILGQILIKDTAGTQENPYIYLGETIAEYPYYQYELVGDLAYVQQKETETENQIQNNPDKAREEGDILLDNDQYWYYEQDESGNIKRYPVSIVTGRQAVAFNELQKISEDLEYDYYYRVEKVYFCCNPVENQTENPAACVYRGWYYPSYPENEEIYIPVTEGDGKTATHYISEASYSLTPGSGNYDFVPGGDNSCQVEVNSLYYRGGYVNNDWFKKDVFHLTPKASTDDADGEFENFKITVDTKSADDAATTIYAPAVNGDTTTGYNAGTDTDSPAVVDSVGDLQDDFTSEDVEFSSEYMGADVSDAEETIDFADISENTDEEYPEETVSDETDAEVSEETDSDTEVGIEEEEAAEAGDGEANDTSLADSLKDYDLIYINGDMQKDTAEAVLQSGVPCIINDAWVTEDSVLTDVFSALIRNTEEDADGHYVNANVYFFKNTLYSENEDATSLLNKEFNTNFNEDAASEEDKTYESADRMHGFEEIVKYINSENQYRSLGNDSDVSADDSDTQSIEPLDRMISQARAIEYILNYKYKRAMLTKDKINVLEITPAKSSSSQVDDSKIAGWIDKNTEVATIESVKVCCYHDGDGNEANIHDGKADTMWHSAYDVGVKGNTNVFDESIAENDQKNHANGTGASKHWIEITLERGSTISGFTYLPRQGYKNGALKQYKVQLWDENGNRLDKDELTGDTGYVRRQIEDKVSRFSFSQEYQGVKKMRLIFESSLGHDAANDNKFATCAEIGVLSGGISDVTTTTMTASEFVGHIDDIASEYDMIYIGDSMDTRNTLINGNAPLLYTHVGGLKSVGDTLKQGNNFYTKLLGQMDSEYLLDKDTGERYQDSMGRYYFAPISTYDEDGAGYFRGSGNDMTDQKRQELMNFVKSGYPVILGNSLVTGEGSNRTVNKDTVDASSYYYLFLKEALGYSNVMTEAELDDNSKDMKFFVNLTKPQIVFDELPPEPQRIGETIQENQGEIDTGELRYVFHIENDSDAVPAVSTYDCNLYLDLNFDGNLSDKESQDKYITITDSKGNVLVKENGKYQLKLGETYTLERKLPEDYFKLITWKIVVSSNNNEYIQTSRQGYTKQKRMEGQKKQAIKVLQIIPDYTNYYSKVNGTWILQDNKKFQEYLDKVEDFDIQIKSVKISDFDPNELQNYQILIIGFDDAYQNIPNDNGQVDAIKDYIQSGRSVIFSHDTTSYMNYTLTNSEETSDIYPKIAETEYGKDEKYNVFYDKWLNKDGHADSPYNPSWGVSLNNVLRSVVGMDRYGITSDKPASADGTATISQILKKGYALDSGDIDYATLLKYAGDAAFKQGDESRSSSYSQTQALTNGILEGKNLGSDATTSQATKVNDGAITQYPYRVGDTLNISVTHGQWYQLALEQDLDLAGRSDGKTDIVVWYCLSGQALYDNSPNDVRNYYYYYSKGNVIYTGTGHRPINDNADETKLFINSIVAAANVTAVQPEVNFVQTLSPTAETEAARYYMTDQSSWTSGEANTLEKDMTYYINVRDYNMMSADLSQEDLDKQEMTVQFFIDDVNGTNVDGCPATGTVSDITANIGTLTGYGNVGNVTIGSDGMFHLTQNSAYALQISDIEQYLRSQTDMNGYKENCNVYVKVTSTVYLYGQKTTSTAWASIDLKQRQLFEMD